ncbi:MAG: response regulator [Candidatus Competibacteraceae bacterium]|nr:response regulator [Candidatus Competibacteraceae bacterium]
MTLNIRRVVLLLALLPATLLSTSLILYFAYIRIQDMERNLWVRGEAIVAHLAPASAYGVYAGNRLLLEPLVNTLLRTADLTQVVIRDQAGTVLIDRRAPSKPQELENVLWFEAPIHHLLIAVDDFNAADFQPQPAVNPGPVIGRVRVALSRESTLQRQRTVVWTGILTLLVCLSLVTGVGIYVGSLIYRPIQRLSAAFHALSQGHWAFHRPEPAASPFKFRELEVLEEGLQSAADRLNQARLRLEDQVQDATEELRCTLQALERKNAELEQAHQAALEANEAKSRFLSSMSHDIRTPLHGVIASADLLLRTRRLHRAQRHHIQTIHQSATILLNLVNNILDASKIEATGEITLRRVVFDLTALLRQMKSVFAPEAKAKSVNFMLQIDSHAPRWVCGDPTRLGQILLNLISNAIKFTERGSVTIATRSIADIPITSKSHWAQVRFEVTDTGLGLDATISAHLFERFSQHHTASRHSGGSGLGLSIAKQLVERMSGKIGVESTPHRGSCFWFEVPLLRATEPHTTTERSALLSPPTGRPSVRRPLRILVAEDHRISRQVIRDILRSAGHRVYLVADGQAAFDALLGSTVFDLAILDLQMPRLYGHEVIARYRQRAPDSSLPTILLTADVTKEARAAANTVGVNRFLTKPVTVDGLLDAIAAVVENGGDPAPTAPPSAQASAHAAHARPVLQPDRLNHLARITRLDLSRIIDAFKNDSEQDLKQLDVLAESKDWERIRAIAHHVKGGAAEIGADQLADQCRAIGDAVQRADFVALQKGIQQARVAWADVVEQLKTYPAPECVSPREEGGD